MIRHRSLGLLAALALGLMAVLPGTAARGDPTTTPTSQPAQAADGIALFMSGQIKPAEEAFINADWTNGAFVATDPLLGLTQSQYVDEQTRDPAFVDRFRDRLSILRSLGSLVDSHGGAVRGRGNIDDARAIYLAIRACGTYLTTRKDEIPMLMALGQKFISLSHDRLATFPKD
jgi:hypothetical protein